MKRFSGLLALVALVGMASGCSIIDRLFLLNTDGPYAHQARHGGGQCRDGECVDGACSEGQRGPGGCQPGCEDCAAGHCKIGRAHV